MKSQDDENTRDKIASFSEFCVCTYRKGAPINQDYDITIGNVAEDLIETDSKLFG